MLTVLRQRNFALLWFGQLISLTGDYVLIVALPFYIYQITGSAIATGVMFLVQALPSLFLGSLAGVFVDRWNRKWTMIVADLARAGILLLLLFVHSRDLLWVIYVVALIEQIISQFFIPAKGAIIPNLVEEQHLMPANSLNSTSDAITRLVGPPLGGALLALFGLSSVALVDSSSYLISGMMILLILMPSRSTERACHPEPFASLKGKLSEGFSSPDAEILRSPTINRGATDDSRESETEQQGETSQPKQIATTALANVWREWLAGLRLVIQERLLTALFVALGFIMLSQGIINVLIVVFVKAVLHGNASTFGLLITFQGVGMLLGSVLVGQWGKRLSPAILLALGTVPGGVILWVILNVPNIFVTFALITVLGVLVVGFFITEQTLLQNGVADEYRGRVLGAYSTTSSLLLIIGIGCGSVLGNYLGVVGALDIAGGLFAVAGLVAFMMLRGVKLSSISKA
jgi:MFS family permease